MDKFKNESSEYSISEGSLGFSIDGSLPLDLISRILKFRVQENQP